MRTLFKDEELQKEFDVKGFVVVPMLNDDEVDALLQLYQKHYTDTPSGFASSSYLNDYGQKKEISDAAQKILAPRISEWLRDHRSLGSAFLCKAPGQNSMLPMHSDWTIVDEERFDAVNIWTPLTLVNEVNGTLEMLPGSQQSFRVLRAPTMPFIAMGNEDHIYPHMVKMMVRPGDAVILNQAVIHYSGPNDSDAPRIAMTSGATSDKATLQFNYWDREKGMLETYGMDHDFLLKFDDFFNDISQRPKHGKFIGSKPFEYSVLNTQEVLERLGVEPEPMAERPKSWWQKLWA